MCMRMCGCVCKFIASWHHCSCLLQNPHFRIIFRRWKSKNNNLFAAAWFMSSLFFLAKYKGITNRRQINVSESVKRTLAKMSARNMNELTAELLRNKELKYKIRCCFKKKALLSQKILLFEESKCEKIATNILAIIINGTGHLRRQTIFAIIWLFSLE